MISRTLQSRGDRQIGLFLAGQTLSVAGDSFYLVALPWLYIGLHRVSSLGIVLAGYGVGRILTLIVGGKAADRFGVRGTIMVADGGRFAITCVLWADASTVGRHLLLGVPLITALGMLGGLFQPAYASTLPRLAGPDRLQRVNSINTACVGVASLAGPAVAGVVINQFGPGLGFGIDALSFLLSLVSVLLMGQIRTEPGPARAGAGLLSRGWFGDWKHIVRTVPAMRVSLGVAIIANLTWAGLTEIALPRLISTWSGTSTGFGAVIAAASVGGITGAVLAAKLGGKRNVGALAMLLGIFQAACIAVTPLAHGATGAAIIFAALGVANSITNITMVTLMQQGIPLESMGRAMALFQFCSYAPYSLSTLLGGAVTTLIGPSVMFEITAIGMTAAFLRGLMVRPYKFSRSSRHQPSPSMPEPMAEESS